MHENYQPDQPDQPNLTSDPVVVNDVMPPHRRRRPGKMATATAATVGGVLLLAVFNAVGNSSTASSNTPAPRATFTSVPSTTPTPTPSWTPSTSYTPEPEPEAPSASSVWSDFSATNKAEICADKSTDRVTTFNVKAYVYADGVTGIDLYNAAEVAAAVNCPKPKPVSYRTVNERTLAKVIRDPDGHVGEGYVVYGEVTQFDSATGLDSFRGDVANRNATSAYGGYFDGENSMFEGKESALEDLIDGDVFKAKVVVKGSLSYDTQIGGSTTVPVFTVTSISQIGHIN